MDEKTVRTEVQSIFGKVLKSEYEEIKDNLNPALTANNNCPYQKCDGSGFIYIQSGLTRAAVECKCYGEEVLRRKLVNSNMSPDIWNKQWGKTKTSGVLLKPIKNPPPKQLKVGKNKKPLVVQEPENPQENLERSYEQIQLKQDLQYFVSEYIRVTLGFLKKNPVEDVQNLMFFGDTGRGKTFMMNFIGKEYLKNEKRVYFTTMRSLVKDILDPEKEIEKKVAEVDLLLIDELGYEYHTDTGWAITQIKELLRTRYNKKLPVVCTTNLYPSELEALYDKSLMSLFKGTYLMMYIDNPEGDYRIEEAHQNLNAFQQAFDI